MPNIPPGPKTILLNGVAIGEFISTGDTEKDVAAARDFLKDKGLHKEVSLFQAMFNQALAFANTSAYLYDRDFSKAPRRGFTRLCLPRQMRKSIKLYRVVLRSALLVRRRISKDIFEI